MRGFMHGAFRCAMPSRSVSGCRDTCTQGGGSRLRECRQIRLTYSSQGLVRGEEGGGERAVGVRAGDGGGEQGGEGAFSWEDRRCPRCCPSPLARCTSVFVFWGLCVCDKCVCVGGRVLCAVSVSVGLCVCVLVNSVNPFYLPVCVSLRGCVIASLAASMHSSVG